MGDEQDVKALSSAHWKVAPASLVKLKLGALLLLEAGVSDEEHDAATEDRGAHQQQQNDVYGHSLVHLFIRL